MTVRVFVGCLTILSGVMAFCQPAAAADPAASAFTKLFIDACTPNIGRPDQVRAWAAAHHLAAVTDPASLKVFVGEGDGGAAWAVPAASGPFALSIRAATDACSVWARAADPAETRKYFEQLIEGVARPGIVISKTRDSHAPTPFGDLNVLAYDVTTPGAPHVLVFILQTAERPGGAFQAWAEVAATKSPN